MSVEPASLPLAELALRLAAATGIGGLLGINRDLHNKPAGLRTHALVGLGAALVTVTAYEISGGDGSAVARTVQGVIAGIGFLGAGVIMHSPSRPIVHGLTTAASIWIVAGLGVACGGGHWRSAALAGVMALLVLTLGERIENVIHRVAGRKSDPA